MCVEVDKSWSFRCPHCNEVHTHGAGAGHRVAHCHPDSPFKEMGYFLVKKESLRLPAGAVALQVVEEPYRLTMISFVEKGGHPIKDEEDES